MNNLILKGLTEVENMQFHHIEGGFAENKKFMLAKDIAEIHNRTLDSINRAINRNRKRFKDNIDVIDLKGSNFVPHLMSNGIYSQNSINASKNIYLLSEKGYSKLLKILEDDFAWEQYEKLVDGYFNMRETLNNESMNVAKLLNKQVGLIIGEVDNLNSRIGTIEDKLDSLEISPSQRQYLKNLRNKRVLELIGGKKSEAYKNNSFRSKVYADLSRQFNKYFDIPSYGWTPKNRFLEAQKLIKAYNLSAELSMELENINRQIAI
ncbi:hypothetical protein CLPU_1c00140 [Gottschalkia purinilytica]|uniref:KilA-N DNA-binding domain-containing protein n=1 Tax=Gottschalkia purinilytica TaxID=1503 RepID=A0A0L0WEF5_GOTPU|nr:ORF6C domain-containing protein [Gottschalkia purinilytica]KNF09849.1 hypothetical protein CLPU_1c00140 [Gottschalkia purinilytica]